jgi:hypothetical protein
MAGPGFQVTMSVPLVTNRVWPVPYSHRSLVRYRTARACPPAERCVPRGARGAGPAKSNLNLAQAATGLRGGGQAQPHGVGGDAVGSQHESERLSLFESAFRLTVI